MNKTLLTLAAAIVTFTSAQAIDDNTVIVAYSGTKATITVAPNISQYITNNSSGSHVRLQQAASFAGVNRTTDNTDGEITYILSGTSTDGEFYLEGSYKCTVQVDGLTLTNPSGPAINIQDGKRISFSVKNGTTNTLTDGANEQYNGCLHCKGHLKLKGKGKLTVNGKSKHGVYSKEYCEAKNLTLVINSAAKDGIHCKEYFLMESGTITISQAGDDGIQVERSSDAVTGETTGHEDENSGNFYQEKGTLTISNYSGKAVKADGTISLAGGTRNFAATDTQELAGIRTITISDAAPEYYDLSGRKVTALLPGQVYITRQGTKTTKFVAQ